MSQQLNRRRAAGSMLDGVAVEQASPDDLPEKQKAADGRPSPCMRCNV